MVEYMDHLQVPSRAAGEPAVGAELSPCIHQSRCPILHIRLGASGIEPESRPGSKWPSPRVRTAAGASLAHRTHYQHSISLRGGRRARFRGRQRSNLVPFSLSRVLFAAQAGGWHEDGPPSAGSIESCTSPTRVAPCTSQPSHPRLRSLWYVARSTVSVASTALFRPFGAARLRVGQVKLNGSMWDYCKRYGSVLEVDLSASPSL